ncbi:carboxymuconolactone decarboxylase family protein [Amycolatopsis sp. DSM 110486]|nr:carboxymuconolactone decarboxylase family protein [Amycolatopsis sp. DSM 110486]
MLLLLTESSRSTREKESSHDHDHHSCGARGRDGRREGAPRRGEQGARAGAQHDEGDGEQPGSAEGLPAAAGGALNAGIRERLAIATAQLNGCEYCLSAHTFIGENIAHVPAGELAAARKAESDEAHVQALLELSNEIASNTGNVGEDALSKARAAGVTDEEVGELVLNISLNVLTNYFNVLAGVENDWPVVSL